MKKELVLRGMTEEQIKIFLEWYSVQGEQNASTWFELHDVPTPLMDNSKSIEHHDDRVIAYFREAKAE